MAELSRRDFVRAAAGASVGLAGLSWAPGLRAALAAPPRTGKITDVEHVVIFIQENRSFDHYFGTYRGVRGFDDPRAIKLHDGSGKTVFAQPGYPAPGYGGHPPPFHLPSFQHRERTPHPTPHSGPQHRASNTG